jgi:hypothetical protein
MENSNKSPVGEQVETIPFGAPYIEQSFDLNRADAFTQGLGTTFYHWKSTISPIGLNDKGDYRRQETDVMTSNGYIYNLAGKFTAVLTGNQKDQRRPSEGAVIDASQGNLVMPRFYDPYKSPAIGDCSCVETPEGKRIYLAVGDRLYCDPEANDLVVNKEMLQFSYDSPGVPMFPIRVMDAPIVDSRGVRYQENIDFTISNLGNIVWNESGSNPGIDPETGEGRTYSVRYLYRAFYYITSILREVRITNVTEGFSRKPERMPYFIQVTREYVYHNINNSNQFNKPQNPVVQNRQIQAPLDTINVPDGMVKVETTDFCDDT